MRTPDEELARKILLRDGTWGMTGCLEEAKAQVALRGHNVLDDLTQLHLRLLALMCSGLICNDSSIEIHFKLDLLSVADQLRDLENAGLAVWNGTEYEASPTGKDATRQVGIEMLALDRHRMVGDLEATDRLLKKLRTA
jgi:hypothetical protein